MIAETLQDALTEVRPLPIRYTADDLDLMPEDTDCYELISGKLFVSRAPHLDHQRTITNLIFQFQVYLEKIRLAKFSPRRAKFSARKCRHPRFGFCHARNNQKARGGQRPEV